MKVQSQRGVALVITLVMLSVVTFMAITFLAVSRRERTSVGVTEDQTTARLMADTAVARAQADLISRMLSERTLLAYDFMASTNFISPYGFVRGNTSVTNVNYNFLSSGGTLGADDRLRNIANLQYYARPPVYIRTNSNITLPLDFRFYLDLNRNGRFETNGKLPVVGRFGGFVASNGTEISMTGPGVVSNFFTGDPEWVGILQNPDGRHSASNRFIGRYAFLVLPAGKSLDLNYTYNATRTELVTNSFGYYRNQGIGSWELNLGAFLRDLNTNVWRTYNYNGFGAPIGTESSEDAVGFLRYRYGNDYRNLSSVFTLFGATGSRWFEFDLIDSYADGPLPVVASPDYLHLSPTEVDNPRNPWAGSDNPNGYFDISELFDSTKVPNTGPAGFRYLDRLALAQSAVSSYDRYTFYRWLSQMGMDSAPPAADQIHLNFNNLPPNSATNFIPWTATEFFTTTAERILEVAKVTNIFRTTSGKLATNCIVGDTYVRTGFSLTNILIYPTNEYTASVHRLLQVAVNIYDATTNRPATPFPHLPSVFRPKFGVNGTNIFITGFTEVTNANFVSSITPRNLTLAKDRSGIETDPNPVVYGVPFLIGAKKGFPNFNEFALQNVTQIARKMEVRKLRATDVYPTQTNLMYLLSVSNMFGIECWNSYTQDFNRSLRIRVGGLFTEMLATTNPAGGYQSLVQSAVPYATNIALSRWLSNQFLLPVVRSVTFLPESRYDINTRRFWPISTNDVYGIGGNLFVPDWSLFVTNQFYYALVDESVKPERLVDFVSFANIGTRLDLTKEIASTSVLPTMSGGGEPPNSWLTNRVGGATVRTPTEGMLNQIWISLGQPSISERQWANYSRNEVGGMDRAKSIDLLRRFVGLTPLVYTNNGAVDPLRAELTGKLAFQAAFTPIRKLYQQMSWQANDPLVHYMTSDLLDPENSPNNPARTNSVRFADPPQMRITNDNLGVLNERYRPWGGNPGKSSDEQAYGWRVKDPMVRSSSDWDFPGHPLPSVGWIGRVHRGTPWQTVYLKSGIEPATNWVKWAGSFGTHPTNDWKLVDLFTAAPNDNASRGALGVNQANLAAWSAVLSGVSVLTNTTRSTESVTNQKVGVRELLIQPDGMAGATQLRRIVDGINRTRQRETNGLFQSLGRILATPELTATSPFLDTRQGSQRDFDHLLNDAVMERIPQQILSLLKPDEPRFVVYAFGQALREAPNSVYLGSGVFNRLCTNYQVKAEFVTKTVIRLEGTIAQPRAVIESYNELQGE